MTNTLRVQQFLQLYHSKSYSTDFLHRHLDIPLAEVEQICDALIASGIATRPKFTHYVQGVAVDWAAVHKGLAEKPEWSEA